MLGIVVLAMMPSVQPAHTGAQTPTPDPLAALEFLIGQWKGTQEGEPGQGVVEREYARFLSGRFVQMKNRSVYEPQPKNPKGETHEDMGIFSFDRARKRIVFRQFHTERFVIQYVLDPATTPTAIVFTSESIENIPAGYRARETYRPIGTDQIEEVFEMAEPGKDFAVYSRSVLKRLR